MRVSLPTTLAAALLLPALPTLAQATLSTLPRHQPAAVVRPAGLRAADLTGQRPATRADHMLEALTQRWVSGAWADTSRVTYTTYNATDQNTERITADWNGSAWVVRSKRRQTYDAQGESVVDTIFSYSATNGYRPLLTIRRTYSAAGQLDSINTRVRFGTQWQPYGRDIYTYDANGFPEQLLWQDYIGTSWINSARFLYTTDARGNILTDEYQPTDLSGATFLPTQLTTLTYAANDSLLTAVVADWNATTNAYENSLRSRNVYGTGGQLDSVYNETPSGTNWQLIGLATYAYDSHANRTEELYTVGSTLAGQTNAQRRLFTYDVLSGLTAAVRPTLTVSPNPATDAAAVTVTQAQAGRVTVELTDALGRRVRQWPATPVAAGEQRLTLDLTGVAPGVYSLRVLTPAVSQQQRLVIK